jgi:SAM-dependent methyltransferase
MNRTFTNAIRYVMDEWIPAAIRDSRWFMRPFYMLAYRTADVDRIMDFKSLVRGFAAEDYARFYNNLNSISRNRATDLSRQSLDFVLEGIPGEAGSLLDVGCGLGFLLRGVARRRPEMQLTGLDIRDPDGTETEFTYVQGLAEHLPFPDKAFDVVTCCHTLEHLVHMDRCVEELVRVAKKCVIIVVPRQRYYYYTLDEHVNFFPHEHLLTSRLPFRTFECVDKGGDWACLGRLDESIPLPVV